MPVRSRPSPGQAVRRGGGKKPDRIMIEGRAYSWKAILELRAAQLEAWKASQPQQPALFELHDDRRPVAGRSAAGRYQEPGLLGWRQDPVNPDSPDGTRCS